MKFLQLIQKPQLRGAEVFACQLSTCLNDQGHESIIMPVFTSNANLPFHGRIVPLNASPDKRFWDYQGWKRLANWIQDECPDIVQANAGDTLKYAAMSKLFFGWKQPIVFRNASTISMYIKSTPARLLNKFFLSQVSYVASVSNISKADFLTLYPSFNKHIETLPIGINVEVLPPKMVNQRPTLIHVGGFTYEKNHKCVIRMFQQLLLKQPDAILWLVGDGPLRSEVEKMVIEFDMKEKVVFWGFRNDVMKLIRQADVMLLPSIIEGLPGVILEAFYCETPVVAFNVGGVKEVLDDRTGFLVEPNDETRFLMCVIEALSKSDDVVNRISFGYQLVLAKYLNSAIAQNFLNVYKKIKNC